MNNELQEYIKDMFQMVWRDANLDQADRVTVVNSATTMVMKRVNALIKEKSDKAVDAAYDDWHGSTGL